MQRYQPIFISLLLIVATLAVFWQVRRHEFVGWDDGIHVYENPHLDPVTVSSVLQFWQRPYAELYIPLTYTTWSVIAANARLRAPLPTPGWRTSVLNPHVFHTVNLGLHICNVLLVFAILRLLVGNDWGAGGGALLFGIHPLQVEPVAWVSGLKDVLCAFFCLLALWEYLNYAVANRDGFALRRQRMHYVLATLSFLLALLSKPSAVAVPLVAFVLDYWVVGRTARTVVLPLVGWAALSALWVPLTQFAQPAGNVVRMPLWWRPFIVGDTFSFYLSKLALPLNLGVDYGRTPQFVMQHGWYLSWVMPGVLAALIWRGRQNWPHLIAAAGIFLVALLPVSGLVPFKAQTVSTVTDRYFYLAMLGPALALAWLLSRSSGRQRTVAGFSLVVLALFSMQSKAQVNVWRNSFTLFENAIDVNPRSAAAHFDLGVLLYRQGRDEEARTHFSESLRINPASLPARTFLGLSHLRQGHIQAAQEYFQETLRLSPNYGMPHLNLGIALDRQGKSDEAILRLREAGRLMPHSPGVHANLGITLTRQGKHAEAVTFFRKARELEAGAEHGSTLPAQSGGDAAYTLAQQKYVEDVIAHTLSINPYYASALNKCGAFLVRQGNRQEARIFFDKALQLSAHHKGNINFQSTPAR